MFRPVFGVLLVVVLLYRGRVSYAVSCSTGGVGITLNNG